MSNDKNLLFFTCCNKRYEHFVGLYAFSALYHNQDARIEIGLESKSSFEDKYKEELDFIKYNFGEDSLHLREVEWFDADKRKILPNSVRFINTPERKSEFVYIGDIDILILDKNISNIHKNRMQKTDLPYSNSVRPDTNRMSGLHFTRYDSYYPLPNLENLNLKMLNDEILLYKIIQKKGLPLPPNEWFRPIHGIHVSPNRNLMKTVDTNGRVIPGWGIEKFSKEFEKFHAEILFFNFLDLCNYKIYGVLSQIKEYLRRNNLAYAPF